MKKILVLGAGRVVKPMINYFFENTDYFVTIAGLEIEKNLEFVTETNRGLLKKIDINNTDILTDLIQENNIVVSFLPASLHYNIAILCLKYNKNLITASYVDEKMISLNEEVKKKGLLFLNEIGLDPGIDHIFAMYMKNQAQKEGGEIISFYSFCGGLPAPEANDNPVGYKFSWSPTGVMKASKNSARFLQNGKEVCLASADVFANTSKINIQNMEFFAYANRDSTKYIELYDLKNIQNIMRGTLRYPGWCEFISCLLSLNLLDEEHYILCDQIPLKFIEKFWGLSNENLKDEINQKLKSHGLSDDSFLDWLGVYNKNKLLSKKELTPFDFIVELSSHKMLYQPDERDMVVLHNQMVVKNNEKIYTQEISLVDFAQNGDTAMARTVSLPAAIACDLILQNKVEATGVQIPIIEGLYIPILHKLKLLGITITEKTIF